MASNLLIATGGGFSLGSVGLGVLGIYGFGF